MSIGCEVHPPSAEQLTAAGPVLRGGGSPTEHPEIDQKRQMIGGHPRGGRPDHFDAKHFDRAAHEYMINAQERQRRRECGPRPQSGRCALRIPKPSCETSISARAGNGIEVPEDDSRIAQTGWPSHSGPSSASTCTSRSRRSRPRWVLISCTSKPSTWIEAHNAPRGSDSQRRASLGRGPALTSLEG